MKWWKNLTVQSRLMLLFALLTLTAAINAVIGINNVVSLNEQLYDLKRYIDSYTRHAAAQISLLKTKSAIQSYLLSSQESQDLAQYQGAIYRAESQLWDYLDAQAVDSYYEADSEPTSPS